MRNRDVIRAAGLLLAAIATFSAGAQSTLAPGLASPAEYRVVHDWPVLPEGEVLGSVAGIGVVSRGEVFVFHRAGRTWPKSDVLDLTPIPRPTVDIFDGHRGILLRRRGADLFAMPHGLTIDDHDNVWLTDVALQQVYKFSPDGRLLLTLGERGVAGADALHFNRPTAVAIAGDGSIYVSDGYKNTRVMKFNAAVVARLVPLTAVGDVEMLAAFEFPTTDSPTVIRRATSLAIETKHHLFDTLYHAVALEQEDALLVTADERY